MLAPDLVRTAARSEALADHGDRAGRPAGRADLVQLTSGTVPPIVAMVSGATVGAVLAGRRPRHPVGWLLLALALSLTATGAAAVPHLGAAGPSRLPAGGPVGGPVLPGHRVHRAHPDRLPAAADAHRVAALAPLALVGQ